jgi:hypothetical protein
VFWLIESRGLAGCLLCFTQGLSSAAREAGVVAIDGKGLRCAFERARGGSPLALVNAFSSASGLALGQVGGAAWRWRNCCPAGALLQLLDLKGATVTADAIHWQRDTAQAILDRDADISSVSKPIGSRCMTTLC